MNEALVNGPNSFAPSYDIGGAVEWEIGDWTITGVGMNVGENEDGENYNFFGGQIEYAVDTSLGEGHYRVIIEATSKDFLNSAGEKEDRSALFLSFDQELGDIFGVWIRFGWQDDKAVIDYDALYSGGVNVTGNWYGRGEDNIGIGYAYLDGDRESDIDDTHVAEIYWRFVLNDFFAATADFQYMKDKYKTGVDDIDGYILGVRGAVEF